MFEDRKFLGHILMSFIVLGVLLGVSFFSITYIENLKWYEGSVEVLLIILSVLLSYIFYLLLTANSRAEFIALKTNEWLAVSREQFRRLYDSAPVPYLTLDSRGVIQDMNMSGLRFFGAIREEIEGKDVFSLITPQSQDQKDKLALLYNANVPINREEVEIMTKSKGSKWALLSIFGMKKPFSSERVGLMTLFDITVEKRLDEAKGEFISLASHQLRTPPTTIKWLVDMLRSNDVGSLNDKQHQYLARIYNVNQDMIELSDTLLNVSRFELGRMPVHTVITDVPSLVESVLLELSSIIVKKNIKIERNYNDALIHTESDPKLLRIVIQNLISNAVKYTPDGGLVKLTLNESKHLRTIIISDTGYGIPAGDKDKIFTKTFRAENIQNKVSVPGTGLGLYLVKLTMETLGGTVDFVSVEDQGSTFTVTL
jgi:PAS domain S-box-containing protein